MASVWELEVRIVDELGGVTYLTLPGHVTVEAP